MALQGTPGGVALRSVNPGAQSTGRFRRSSESAAEKRAEVGAVPCASARDDTASALQDRERQNRSSSVSVSSL